MKESQITAQQVEDLLKIKGITLGKGESQYLAKWLGGSCKMISVGQENIQKACNELLLTNIEKFVPISKKWKEKMKEKMGGEINDLRKTRRA